MTSTTRVPAGHQSPTSRQKFDFAFESRLGPRGREAIIAVAAAMAVADGRAEPSEHRSLLAFLKQNRMLVLLGRSETTERYTAEIERTSGGRDGQGNTIDQWDDLDHMLRPLAGMDTARLLASAAAQVAAADGHVHPEETELLRRLHRALGLDQPQEPCRLEQRALVTAVQREAGTQQHLNSVAAANGN